jgi:hypothetical protein
MKGQNLLSDCPYKDGGVPIALPTAGRYQDESGDEGGGRK